MSQSASLPALQSQAVGHGEQQLHVQDTVQHDPLQQRAVHGENPQQDLGALPAEEVQQVGEVHHVSAESLYPVSETYCGRWEV